MNTAPIIQTIGAKIDFSFIEKVLDSPKKDKQIRLFLEKAYRFHRNCLLLLKVSIKKTFENWVQSLPRTVYRMKGYVLSKALANPYLFQYAYGMVNWLPEYVKMEPRLVIIGEGIDDIKYGIQMWNPNNRQPHFR